MTSTGAVGQLRRRIVELRFFDLLVRSLLEVLGMAASAIAGNAAMVEACWRPGNGGMAGVALCGGLNMTGRFALGS